MPRPAMWAAWVFLFWWADYSGTSDRDCWPQGQLVARPCLVQSVLVTGWLGRVMKQLAADLQVALGLVLAHW